MSRVLLGGASQQLTTGTPYWPVHTRTPAAMGSLDADLACDAVVIGGGISGALVAAALVRAGLDTVLLDKGRFGSGSTSASTALVSYEFDLMLSDLIERIGERAAIRAYQLCFSATASLREIVRDLEDPCDYQAKSAVRVTNLEADVKTLEKEARLRNRCDMPVDLADSGALRQRFGVTALCGLVSKNAAQIDPFQLTHRLIARARRGGLRAFEGTKVTQFESGRDWVRLSTAGACEVRARHAVFATGYESERYLHAAGAKRSTDFCLVSHPLKSMGKLAKCHIVENADQYLYVSTFGNRVMAGIEGGSFLGPAERARLIRQKTKEVLNRLETYLPDVTLTPAYAWASTFVNSADSLPYLASSPKFPRAWFLLGYGGNGIASSATLAPILVDLIVKGSNPDAAIFRLGR